MATVLYGSVNFLTFCSLVLNKSFIFDGIVLCMGFMDGENCYLCLQCDFWLIRDVDRIFIRCSDVKNYRVGNMTGNFLTYMLSGLTRMGYFYPMLLLINYFH